MVVIAAVVQLVQRFTQVIVHPEMLSCLTPQPVTAAETKFWPDTTHISSSHIHNQHPLARYYRLSHLFQPHPQSVQSSGQILQTITSLPATPTASTILWPDTTDCHISSSHIHSQYNPLARYYRLSHLFQPHPQSVQSSGQILHTVTSLPATSTVSTILWPDTTDCHISLGHIHSQYNPLA